MTGDLWTLRVLNGLHQGANVPVEVGELTIGASDDCDLILQDAGLPSEVAQFSVAAGSVVCRVVTEQGLEESTLNSGEKFSLSGVDFVFLPVGEPWVPIAETEELSGIREKKDKDTARPIGKLRKKMALIAAALLAIASWFFWDSEPAKITANDGESKQLQEVSKVKEQILPSGVSMKEVGGVKTLVGFVPTMAAMNTLLAELDVDGVVNKVRVTGDLVKAVAMNLKGNGWTDIDADIGEKPGSVKLSGHVEDGLGWAKMKQKLINDFSSVATWQDEVVTTSGQAIILEKMIVAKGLEQEIRVAAKGDRIEVAGSISKERGQLWLEVKKAYEEKYGVNPRIVSVAGKLKNIRVRSISLGKNPYVTTDRGEKILVGAEISGGVVHQILEDRIVLKRGKDLIPLYFD